MTWSKLSDDYSDDTWTLSDAAFRLHTEGLVWSNRKLLDCIIPKDDLRRFAKTPEAVQELLEAGFWQDLGTCYLISHHAQYQRTRAAVIAQQEANQRNGSKGGRPKGKPREQKSQSVTELQSDGTTGGFQTAASGQDFPTHINTGDKTQSVSDPWRETETKRDRPGIEGITSPEISKVEDPWASVSDDQRARDQQWGLDLGSPEPQPEQTVPAACSIHKDKWILASCAECRDAYEARKLMLQAVAS